jgi:hypothetical protein
VTESLVAQGSHAIFTCNREALKTLISLSPEIPFQDINIRDSTLEDIFLQYYDIEATTMEDSREAKG